MYIVGKGRSSGALRWFFKVDDSYETYVDEEAILPWRDLFDMYEKVVIN